MRIDHHWSTDITIHDFKYFSCTTTESFWIWCTVLLPHYIRLTYSFSQLYHYNSFHPLSYLSLTLVHFPFPNVQTKSATTEYQRVLLQYLGAHEEQLAGYTASLAFFQQPHIIIIIIIIINVIIMVEDHQT